MCMSSVLHSSDAFSARSVPGTIIQSLLPFITTGDWGLVTHVGLCKKSAGAQPWHQFFVT